MRAVVVDIFREMRNVQRIGTVRNALRNEHAKFGYSEKW